MATSDFIGDIEMLMAFDKNGHARWVEFRDGTKHTVPLPQDEGPPPLDTFRIGPLNATGPLKNINLLKTEVFEILKWEERDDRGNVVKIHLSPHVSCRPYC
jgi:hypothetical protein